MKTTLELPDALLKEVKIRAVMRGTKLKDEVAELLRRGLAAGEPTVAEVAVIGKDATTGLPIILGGHPAKVDEEATPERVAKLLLDQEMEWAIDASG